jgi:hypothetical protein
VKGGKEEIKKMKKQREENGTRKENEKEVERS